MDWLPGAAPFSHNFSHTGITGIFSLIFIVRATSVWYHPVSLVNYCKRGEQFFSKACYVNQKPFWDREFEWLVKEPPRFSWTGASSSQCLNSWASSSQCQKYSSLIPHVQTTAGVGQNIHFLSWLDSKTKDASDRSLLAAKFSFLFGRQLNVIKNLGKR